MIESLSPLPLISTSAGHNAKDDLEQLLHWLNAEQKDLRAVIVVGTVKLGFLGGDSFSSYGSSGEIVSSVIRGCVLIQTGVCWGTKAVSDLTQQEIEESVVIAGTPFYRRI